MSAIGPPSYSELLELTNKLRGKAVLELPSGTEVVAALTKRDMAIIQWCLGSAVADLLQIGPGSALGGSQD